MIGINSRGVYIFQLTMFAGQVGETGSGSGTDPSFVVELPGGGDLQAPGGEPIELPND